MVPSLTRGTLADQSNTISEAKADSGKQTKLLQNKHILIYFVDYRWLEMVFNPRNKWEQLISKSLRTIHPYLSFVTYRFHVEKAREAGKVQFISTFNYRNYLF